MHTPSAGGGRRTAGKKSGELEARRSRRASKKVPESSSNRHQDWKPSREKVWRATQIVFGTSWCLLTAAGEVFGASCGALGTYNGLLGRLKSLLGPFSRSLGPSWGPLGTSWSPLGALLRPLGALLGPSWELFGASWEPLGGLLGALLIMIAFMCPLFDLFLRFWHKINKRSI